MRFTTYLKETAAEMKHVSFPTQKQATVFTALVIVISALVALYVGAWDYLFAEILNKFI